MTDEKPLRANEESSAPQNATHLLDREAPVEYRQEWTARLAAPVESVELNIASVVIFRLGNEWLALPASVFQEVSEPTGIHSVPHRRNGILQGLVNVRGELLLCVSLSTVLGLEQNKQLETSNRTIYQRLLVVNKGGKRLAFLVDEIFGVYRYHPRELQEVPATLAKTGTAYMTGLLPWHEKMVGTINDEALLSAINGSFQ